ncbi:MAG TPA: hypothetical protein DCX65_07645, partial [Spirochaetaceae bacterium]|nr:hypothetical protein [Spirochaetaceae bacterium]
DMAPLFLFLLATVAGAEEEPFPVPTLAIGPAGAELRLEADAVAFPAGLRLRQQPGAYTLQVLERLPAYLDGGCLVVEYELPASFVAADAAPQPLVAALQLRTLAGQDLDYQLRLRPGRNRLYLHTAVLGAALSSLTLSGLPPELRLRRVAGSDGQVRETVPANAAASRPTSSAPRPLLVDLGTLYDYPPSAWRHAEYELFAWSLYPAILYFDFADYAIQGRFLSRLAYFVEKKGFQGRLLSNQQLQGRHGYNAHNYNGEGLAAFFNAVDASQFQLNPEEELLRQVAVRAGIISGSSAAWQAGSGGILSISREAPSVTGLRNLLMTHESMHGVFYEEPYHADFARRYWAETMTADQRSFWQLFMDMLSYSTTDEYLMVNELQAYMLQYPQIHNAWYYNTLVRDRLLLAYPEQRPRIEAFYAANPDFFTATARRFNQELFSLTGLIGGDVRCLVPAGRPAD